MKKYAKIIDTQTHECEVGLGNDITFYESIGMVESDVEQGPNGSWYIQGYAPESSIPQYIKQRQAAYPAIEEQLDMIYWDQINHTTLWSDMITEIKNKYPKE